MISVLLEGTQKVIVSGVSFVRERADDALSSAQACEDILSSAELRRGKPPFYFVLCFGDGFCRSSHYNRAPPCSQHAAAHLGHEQCCAFVLGSVSGSNAGRDSVGLLSFGHLQGGETEPPMLTEKCPGATIKWTVRSKTAIFG